MRAPFSVVTITGASSGLGASLARAYAAPRVALGLHGRDRQRLEATAQVCEARGATVNTAIIDVTEASPWHHGCGSLMLGTRSIY